MADTKMIKVSLDRMYTAHGEHYGPGIVEVPQDVAATLKEGQKRAKASGPAVKGSTMEMQDDTEASIKLMPAANGVEGAAVEGAAGTPAGEGLSENNES